MKQFIGCDVHKKYSVFVSVDEAGDGEPRGAVRIPPPHVPGIFSGDCGRRGIYRGRIETDSVLTPLESHLTDQSWQEVIALSAVLAGRRVRPLIDHLIRKSGEADFSEVANQTSLLLAQCVVDDCLLSPDLADGALREIVRHSFFCSAMIAELAGGKYQQRFGELLEDILIQERRGLFAAEYAYATFSDARDGSPPLAAKEGVE